MKKKVVCYMRVSTQDQDTGLQRSAIERYCTNQGWTLTKVYEDVGISGAKDDRPALNQLKDDCIKGKLDVVICWKFDRMARSSQHLLECLQLFQRYGVDFVSTTEGIDTSTAVGKMVYTFLGAIAEFERSLIQERVKAGMARAKEAGVKIGRPRVGFDLQRAIELRKQGLGYKQLAKELNCSRSSLHRYLRDVPIPKGPETPSP